MVEFAVALGSKLDVINKHSFNNFRLRVGEGPPLLGRSGTSSSPSQALPPLSPLLATPQLTPSPLQPPLWGWSMKLLGQELWGSATPSLSHTSPGPLFL